MANQRNRELAISGLLIAIGIIIPLISPFKIVLEPASFTLASHVAIFLAMFISPRVAIFVALGTAAGFFLAGFPPVIGLRALSQVIYATLGAFYLVKNPLESMSWIKQRGFSFVMGIIHMAAEVVVVSIFYFSGALGGSAAFDQNFMYSVLLLVGVGTLIHSMFDFEIARFLELRISKLKKLKD